MNIWANLQAADLLLFFGRVRRSTVVDAIFDDWLFCFLEDR